MAIFNWKKARISNAFAILTLLCSVNRSVAVENNPDIFDPNLQLEGYATLDPSPPSDGWLLSCANTLANDTDIVKPFIDRKRRPYRLGDCIKTCHECEYDWDKDKSTIASLYGAAACPCNGENNLRCAESRNDLMNLTKIEQIFEEVGKRDGFVKPDPNSVVMHLRLGDVVEAQKYDAGELLIHGGTGGHPMNLRSKTHDIRSVNEVLELLDEADKLTHRQHKIIIVGGSHRPQFYQKSRVYANCLARGLAKAGRQVEMFLDGDADKDFYFMCHAKMFVESTGGFSMLMGVLAKRQGVIKTWNFEAEYKAFNGTRKQTNDAASGNGFSWAAGLDP